MASNKENIPCTDNEMMMVDNDRSMPLNSLASSDDSHSRQLNDNELMVFEGLKQLTKAIFSPQYQTQSDSPSKTVAMSPSKMTNKGSGGSTPTVAMSPCKIRLNARRMDDAMLAAEKFCSMVVHQIVSLNDDGSSHKNQLDVYHSVHKDLFGN